MIYGRPEDDFFEANPDHLYIPEIAQLIEKLNGDRAWAGKLMWAVWLIYHPQSSLFEMPLESRREWVVVNYLNVDTSIEWALLYDVIKIFPHISMSVEARMYYDAVMLYETALEESKFLDAKSKVAFMKTIGTASREIGKLKTLYIEVEQMKEKAAGKVQSGWASKRKGTFTKSQ